MKITTVLVVDSIEQSLPFWVDRAGFEKLVEVPEEDHLGFVILVHEGAELMLQTKSSVRNDAPQFAPEENGYRSSLFIEVDNLDEMKQRLSGYPIAMEERVAFYGMREIGVFDGDGNTVVFAQKA